MPFQYEQKVEAQDGYNLVLTIDEVFSIIWSKLWRKALKTTKLKIVQPVL